MVHESNPPPTHTHTHTVNRHIPAHTHLIHADSSDPGDRKRKQERDGDERIRERTGKRREGRMSSAEGTRDGCDMTENQTACLRSSSPTTESSFEVRFYLVPLTLLSLTQFCTTHRATNSHTLTDPLSRV